MHHFLKTSKSFILMQTPLQLDIWLQSNEGFDNAKNNMKQKEFEHCFCQYQKNNIPDIRLIPLDHVTYGHIPLMLADKSPLILGLLSV